MVSTQVGRWEPPGAEFPPGHKALERYLNVRAVRRAIHVTHSAAFLECTDPPYDALSSRDGVGVAAELAAVLDDPRRTVRVLFFNGVRDLVCNHLRTETVLEQLAWAGANSYARSGTGQHKRAKFPTSKAPISANFHSFRLIFGRAIISRNALEA